jgi:hypothetical protein
LSNLSAFFGSQSAQHTALFQKKKGARFYVAGIAGVPQSCSPAPRRSLLFLVNNTAPAAEAAFIELQASRCLPIAFV